MFEKLEMILFKFSTLKDMFCFLATVNEKEVSKCISSAEGQGILKNFFTKGGITYASMIVGLSQTSDLYDLTLI
jgi:hypothetical protein